MPDSLYEPTLHPESVVVGAGRPPRVAGAPLTEPIVLSSTYFGSPEQNAYLRQQGNASIHALQDALGELDGGRALIFASGMAAISAVAEGQPAGAVAVVPASSYSGTGSVFRDQQALGRMALREVDITDTAAVLAALPGADLVWLESATNPLMGVPDLPAVLGAARQHGVRSYVDATFCSPLLQRPLALGADVVMHSATKLLAGHSDLLMGVLVSGSDELHDRLKARRDNTGAIPGGLETFLTLRGLRTLAVRLERAQANAHELATRLAAHPAVTRVRYPGLADDPFHARAIAQQDGPGSMLSFEVTGGRAAADAVCAAVRVITHATSLGGVESLIERRARYDMDAERGVPAGLLRLSVGIEHVEDLWADLEQALG